MNMHPNFCTTSPHPLLAPEFAKRNPHKISISHDFDTKHQESKSTNSSHICIGCLTVKLKLSFDIAIYRHHVGPQQDRPDEQLKTASVRNRDQHSERSIRA